MSNGSMTHAGIAQPSERRATSAQTQVKLLQPAPSSEQHDYQIVVRRYGLLRPLDWRPEAEEEMARMARLWNRLVAIEAENRAEYFRIMQSPELDALQGVIESLKQRIKTLRDRRGEMRRAAKRKVKTPEIDAQIAALGRECAQTIGQARLARLVMRDTKRSALAALEARRKAAVTAARQPHNPDAPWWSNGNAVIASYDRARQAMIRRTKGECRSADAAPGAVPEEQRKGDVTAKRGELHERLGNADRLVNQIQGGMTEWQLRDGAHSQVRIAPDPRGYRRRRGDRTIERVLLTVVVSRGADGEHTVTWPMILDRPLPTGARIQEVTVTRQRCAGAWRWAAVFLCRVPRGEMVADAAPAACGIDLGWRQMDGYVRVAMLASAVGTEEVKLPQSLVDRLLRYHELQSQAHQLRHEMLERLAAVNWRRAPAPLLERATLLLGRIDDNGALCASALELRGLAAEWRAIAPRYLDELLSELSDWTLDDRRLWLAAAGRRRALAARREHYRIAARRIVDRYGVVGLETVNWSRAATSAKEKLPPAARRMRFIAGIYELRQAIESAAKREGARLYYHEGASSFICPDCAHATDVNNRAALHWSCGHCARSHDQDAAAARILFAAAAASAPATQETPPALAWVMRLQNKRKKRAAQQTSAAAPLALAERSQ